MTLGIAQEHVFCFGTFYFRSIRHDFLMEDIYPGESRSDGGISNNNYCGQNQSRYPFHLSQVSRLSDDNIFNIVVVEYIPAFMSQHHGYL